MGREYDRAIAIAAALKATHDRLTAEINELIRQNKRFSAEAAEIANERSEVRLAWDRVLGRIRRMEAG